MIAEIDAMLIKTAALIKIYEIDKMLLKAIGWLINLFLLILLVAATAIAATVSPILGFMGGVVTFAVISTIFD